MTRDFAVPRPLGAALVLVGVGVLGAAGAWTAMASRDALMEERDAKGAFVARAVSAGAGAGHGTVAPARNLAVTADTATLAAAAVEAMVRATLSGAGGVVLSSRSEAKPGDPVPGADGRIEVQASVRGTMDALQAGLFRLEEGPPLVIVEAMEVRRPDDATPDAAAEAASPLLAATLTVSAFWKRPSAEGARPAP